MTQKAWPLVLLREVVELCMHKRLVRAVADAMDLKPQAMYAWMGTTTAGATVLTSRAARMRLLAISHLRQPELAEVSAKAREGVQRLEQAQSEGDHA